MTKPRFTCVVLAQMILAITLTSFTTSPSTTNTDYYSNNESIEVDFQNKYGLIGTWIKQDDPESSLTFKSDFTVIVKSKEGTKTERWSVEEMNREVCIGNEKCRYFEASETNLVIKEKKIKYKYYKLQS